MTPLMIQLGATPSPVHTGVQRTPARVVAGATKAQLKATPFVLPLADMQPAQADAVLTEQLADCSQAGALPVLHWSLQARPTAAGRGSGKTVSGAFIVIHAKRG